MPDINTRWFQTKLRDKELSQRKLAAALGLDASAVSLMLSGKRRITTSEAVEMSRLLGLPLNEVLEHAGIDPGQPLDSVPLVGTMDSEGEIHAVKTGRRIGLTIALPGSTVAVEANDTSSPVYGWQFFYDPRPGVDADAVGRLCIVQLMTGQQYCRFLKPAKTRGNFDLVGGWFDVTVENVKVKSASPILWIKT